MIVKTTINLLKLLYIAQKISNQIFIKFENINKGYLIFFKGKNIFK